MELSLIMYSQHFAKLITNYVHILITGQRNIRTWHNNISHNNRQVKATRTKTLLPIRDKKLLIQDKDDH